MGNDARQPKESFGSVSEYVAHGTVEKIIGKDNDLRIPKLCFFSSQAVLYKD